MVRCSSLESRLQNCFPPCKQLVNYESQPKLMYWYTFCHIDKVNQVDILQQNIYLMLGAIQVLHNAMGGGGVSFPGKKGYEGVMFNVINVKRGWVGVKFPGKKALYNT